MFSLSQGRGTAGPARPGAQNFPRPGVAAAAGVGPVGTVAGVPGVAGAGKCDLAYFYKLLFKFRLRNKLTTKRPVLHQIQR